MPYDLKSLTTDITAVVRATRDDNERCDRITPFLRKWMDGPSPLLPEKYTLPCDGRACGHLLYTDPEGEYFIISVVFPSGTSSGVHYHGSWGVIGILQGTDEETRYSRDVSPGDIHIGQPCELNTVYKIYSPPGTITYLKPPLEGFHRVRAAGDETGVSLHILGGTPETHPHFFCDGDTRKLIDFPMAAIITHDPMIR
ncbi:MAG TPA: cysteine dioxygenase family protein [Dehalococcoidia bacterium]|nr:cysteine dioxygenase family protein [Dehalococcoidia bacterium]